VDSGGSKKKGESVIIYLKRMKGGRESEKKEARHEETRRNGCGAASD
jgi:hypothetical protein